VHIFGRTNKTLLSVDATCKMVIDKHKVKPSISVAAE